MSEVTDLDILVPQPKTVRFGGVEYSIPADIPMEIFLRINQAGQLKDEDGEPDQIAQINALTGAISDLFTFEIADRISPEEEATIKKNVEGVLARRGVKFCFTLISNIYKDDEDEPGEGTGAVQAPTEDSSGTTSSSTLPSQTKTETTEPVGSSV